MSIMTIMMIMIIPLTLMTILTSTRSTITPHDLVPSSKVSWNTKICSGITITAIMVNHLHYHHHQAANFADSGDDG